MEASIRTEVNCPISSDLLESLITTWGVEVACYGNVVLFFLPIERGQFQEATTSPKRNIR